MASNTPPSGKLDRALGLRRLLVRGLRREGAGKLCKDEPSDFTLRGELVSISLLGSALLGLLIVAVDLFGWSIWGAVGALVLTLLAAVGITALSTPVIPYLIVLAAWVGAGVLQLTGPGLGALA